MSKRKRYKRVDKVEGEVYDDWYEQQLKELGINQPPHRKRIINEAYKKLTEKN